MSARNTIAARRSSGPRLDFGEHMRIPILSIRKSPVSTPKMVLALKYNIVLNKILKGETDKGLGLGSKPDWSAREDFHSSFNVAFLQPLEGHRGLTTCFCFQHGVDTACLDLFSMRSYGCSDAFFLRMASNAAANLLLGWCHHQLQFARCRS